MYPQSSTKVKEKNEKKIIFKSFDHI
jgi:hypothetical protein